MAEGMDRKIVPAWRRRPPAIMAGARLGQIVPDTGVKVQASLDEYYLPRLHAGLTGVVEIGIWPGNRGGRNVEA